MIDAGSGVDLIAGAVAHASRCAVIDADGAHAYAELLAHSEALARGMLGQRQDLAEQRVALLLRPGFEHVAVQWGIWRAGGVAVPLAVEHPVAELARLIGDARPEMIVASPDLMPTAAAACGGVRCLTPDGLLAEPSAPGALPGVEPQRRAMIVYTSGTTARPKGVVSTHAGLRSQVQTLADAWEWRPDDRILHVLPLHHVHGIVNALSCALWSGACCEFHAAGDAAGIWERLSSGDVTVFMAVPTLYRRLISAFEHGSEERRHRWTAGSRGLRLMVSGSAALPVATLQRWRQVTDHVLLERYGMTEIGMALGNPLHGERRAGTVGQPFPGVQARIVDESSEPVTSGDSGEIQVRGPQVFLEYWQRPEATRAAFTADGWFRTGDEGVIEDGYWRIVGRRSADIIKSGGYKLSALEIEEILRQYEGVEDVAVVGVADVDWGERVCAAVQGTPGADLEAEALRQWCKGRVAPYKVPKQVLVVPGLPRNAMGKVIKADLRSLFDRNVTPPPGTEP